MEPAGRSSCQLGRGNPRSIPPMQPGWPTAPSPSRTRVSLLLPGQGDSPSLRTQSTQSAFGGVVSSINEAGRPRTL
jgi:hypothetical protein